MKSKMSHSRRYFRQRRGSALILALSFIVLLTILVLAFFSYTSLHQQISRTDNKQVAAKIFAQGEINTLICDLKQEIVAGSSNYTYGTNQVYIPLSATNMVPVRVGTDDTLPNLVKISIYGIPFYPGGPNRASSASSSNASMNGRYISPARWNDPLFLPKTNTNSSTDLTPINMFSPPNWVLVARDGSNPTNWNQNMCWSATNNSTVIGRFAYAIYDEGGELDVNVAGYPLESSTNFTANKGGLAYADLTAIPGMTDDAISALVGWRNYASSQPNGNFPSYTFSAASVTNYFNSIQGNTSGFLQTANTNIFNNQSDSMFVSRQQLIQFLTQSVATNNADQASLQNALQYLGTFSRTLEQPCFVPDPNRPKNTHHALASSTATSQGYGGNDTYDPTGTKQNQINPSLLTVRDVNNQPVLKRRFPLSRLALVSTANQTLRSGGSIGSINTPGTLAYEIHDYFGLTWDTSSLRWNYTSPDGTTTASSIKTLAQVAAVSPVREPDFFETLYAVICCDTLGKQAGYFDSAPSPHMFTSGYAAIDGSVEFQIMQIGVNLIDQYDSSSYPTCIAYYDSATSTSRPFFGVKNLPYLYGYQNSWYRMKQLIPVTDFPTNQVPPSDMPPTNGVAYETWTALQPILWNPHVPNPNLDTSLAPTHFRVLAMDVANFPSNFPTLNSPIAATPAIYPGVRPAWWAGPGIETTYPATASYAAAAGMTSTNSLYRFPAVTIDGVNSYLTFSETPNTVSNTPASFQEPYRLLYQYPPGCNADVGSSYSAGKFTLDARSGAVVDATMATSDAPVDGKTVIGFFLGKCWSGPYNYLVPTNNANIAAGEARNCLVDGVIGGGSTATDLQLWLQYQNPSGGWTTYDVIYDVHLSGGTKNDIDDADVPPNCRGNKAAFRIDPRTDRWGLATMQNSPLATNPVNTTLPTAGTLNAGEYNFPQATTLSPHAGATSTDVVYSLILEGGGGVEPPGWGKFPQNLFPNSLLANTTNTATQCLPGVVTGNRISYYTDPDGVIRRAGGAFFSGSDGLAMATGNFNSRPVVLNRPFQSVEEMGYVFSGTPWENLNFFTPESGYSPLLDAFCLNELDNAPANVTVAGRVNLNTRQPVVLQSLIQGVSKAEGGVMSDSEASNAAQALVNWTTNTTTTNGICIKGPLRNRSELVGKFVSSVNSSLGLANNPPLVCIDGTKSYSGFSSVLSTNIFASPSDAAIKRRRECVVRALADAGNVRTWNLMIDLVAQVGRYRGNATNLDSFTVEGESRIWVHLAIDRYTGQVIAKQVEPVSE